MEGTTNPNVIEFGIKFQERQRQLELAQQQLKESYKQWDIQQNKLKEYEKDSWKAKQQLLQSTSQWNRLEWEYHQLQEKVRECQEQTSQVQQAKIEMELKWNQEQEKWKEQVEEVIFAPHITRMDLFQKDWEAQVEQKQLILRERDECREILQQRIEKMKNDCVWFEQQQVQIERDIQTIKLDNQKQDEYAEQLSNQVREALQKRIQLREQLKKQAEHGISL